jgi:hypothetical protein
MREVWRVIDEFPQYYVSNLGRVKNADTGKILRPRRHRDGYVYQTLYNRKGRPHSRYISRLVASAFIGDVKNFDVDHLDNDRSNNNVDNLEIVTTKINVQRSWNRGRVHPRMIPIRIVETGEEFRSISDCGRYLNRDRSTVLRALYQGTITAGVHIEKVNLRG